MQSHPFQEQQKTFTLKSPGELWHICYEMEYGLRSGVALIIDFCTAKIFAVWGKNRYKSHTPKFLPAHLWFGLGSAGIPVELGCDEDDDDDDDEKEGFTQQSSFEWKISPNCLQLLLPHTNPGMQSLRPK